MSLAKEPVLLLFPISAVVAAPAIYEALREVQQGRRQFRPRLHQFRPPGRRRGRARGHQDLQEMNIVEHVASDGRAPPRRISSASLPIPDRRRGARCRAECSASSWWLDKATGMPFDPHLQVGMQFDRLAYENSLIARCMGDVLGFSPPLIVEEGDVDEIADRCAYQPQAARARSARGMSVNKHRSRPHL